MAPATSDRNHFLVGITGGIGSGKSLIARIFMLLGVPVYDSDQRARALMTEDDDVRQSIANLLGSDAYLPDGTLNREAISAVVFNDRDVLARLNEIVHPAVGRDFEHWASTVSSPRGYVLKEAALIFEAGLHEQLDHVILVSAPNELRIARVMKRDGVTEEQVRNRMDKQWPEDEKARMSDSIIINDNFAPLIKQVLDIDKLLRHLAPGSHTER